MNSISLFKLYNLKKIAKDKFILLLTMLIIFITTALSIAVPIISKDISNYNKQNIRTVNGGDLFVQANYKSKAFDDELQKIKNEGYKITYKQDSATIFKNSKKIKLYSHLLISNENLKDNEIILSTYIASNLMLKINDKVTVNSKTYTIKDIESIPNGVTNEQKIMGYGKIKGTPTHKDLIYISRNTAGTALKKRLQNKETGYKYTSIKDQESSINNNTASQTASFGILTSIGYILSSAVVISTCIVTIMKRKKDIAIMKLLSIKNNSIKNALRLELSIMIFIPVILGTAASLLVSSLILKFTYVPDILSFMDKLLLIIKGMALNLFIFIIFVNLPLSFINSIKGLWLIKDNLNNTLAKKRLFFFVIILIPIMMFIYSLYSGGTFNIITSTLIIFLILIFLMFISLIIKLLSKLPFKNKLIMYTLKNINKNIFSISLVSVSLSITIVVILTAFSLTNSINNSINKSFELTLPYNYFVSTSNNSLERALTKKNGVDGYIKKYSSDAKTLNDNLNDKSIRLSEIKQSDYKLKLSVVKGETLFSKTTGCLITTNYQKSNNLKIGDTLNINVNNKIISLKIKGIYNNSILNSNDILIPYEGIGTDYSFYVKAKENSKWMDKIGDGAAIYVGSLGSGVSKLISNYLKTFKFLSIMIIISSIIFNLNLLSLTFMEERKDETIIRAVGIGKAFISKVYILKGLLIILLSTIMSYFFFKLILKGIAAIMSIKAYNSTSDLLLTLTVSAVLSFAAIIYPYARMKKYNAYEFLREN